MIRSIFILANILICGSVMAASHDPKFLELFRAGTNANCADRLTNPSDDGGRKNIMRQYRVTVASTVELKNYFDELMTRSGQTPPLRYIPNLRFTWAVARMVRFRLHFGRDPDDFDYMPTGYEKSLTEIYRKLDIILGSDISNTWYESTPGIDLKRVRGLIERGRVDHGLDPLRNAFAIRVLPSDSEDSMFLTVEPYNSDDWALLESRPEAYLYLSEILMGEGLPVRLSAQVIQAVEERLAQRP